MSTFVSVTFVMVAERQVGLAAHDKKHVVELVGVNGSSLLLFLYIPFGH
jgi:hypothetical protein